MCRKCSQEKESPYHSLLKLSFGLAKNRDLWICMVTVDKNTRHDTINTVLAIALHSGLSVGLQQASEYTMDDIVLEAM
jgi:hypothetical protein